MNQIEVEKITHLRRFKDLPPDHKKRMERERKSKENTEVMSPSATEYDTQQCDFPLPAHRCAHSSP